MEILNSRMLLRPLDPERAVRFYRDVLGLAIAREFPGGTVFFLGQGYLEVSGTGSQGPSQDQSLWLQVRDLYGEVHRLRQHDDVRLLADPEQKPWGLHEAWIADPDGMPIVLVEIPAEHPLRVDVRQ